ncbi:permease-like cell division protein FtsX [Actinoplanes oblitus]|uniref:Permease-like cell division protein FtsX n=1 Tax=Actinoplanes oblitus TaxID=3040509 RepID=A0ABY8WFQ0_9ACTN|nr:permease-like cell division protein FtsX [Actinoplanes oblitus]WIM94560.1 permease-like cell division protein FtsX [Actinoplanes oblitus]
MSDVSAQPGEPVETPAPKTPSGRFAAPVPEPRPSRGWLVPALIALVVGAGATFGGLWLAGWRPAGDQPAAEREYSVLVVLKQDATPEQKDAVKATLTGLPGRDGDARLVSKAEAYAEAQKAYQGTDMLKDITEAKMPESFRVVSKSVSFSCTPLKPLADNKGVSKLSVVVRATEDQPGATINC